MERKQVYLVPIFASPQNASFPPQAHPNKHLIESSQFHVW